MKYKTCIFILSFLFCLIFKEVAALSNDTSIDFPITKRRFLMGTAGFVPRHFPRFKSQDVLDYWDDVAKVGELYGVHTNWRDNKKTTGKIPRIIQVAYQESQQKNFDLLIVLGFEIGKNTDLAIKQNPVNNWTNKVVIREFKTLMRQILNEYKNVKFLCIGNEVNMYYERHPKDFDNFVKAYIEIFDEIKKEFPNVQIGTNFNLETLKGKGYLTGEMSRRRPEWFLLEKFQDKFDFLAFTTYPYFDIGDPQDIPDNYFKEITNYTDKPIGFTEISWMARERYGGKYSALNVQGFTGSEDEQVEFLIKFLRLTQDMNLRFINWTFINDISDWKEGDVPGQNVLFDSIGLKYNDGRAKKIWEAWLNLRKIPLLALRESVTIR